MRSFIQVMGTVVVYFGSLIFLISKLWHCSFSLQVLGIDVGQVVKWPLVYFFSFGIPIVATIGWLALVESVCKKIEVKDDLGYLKDQLRCLKFFHRLCFFLFLSIIPVCSALESAKEEDFSAVMLLVACIAVQLAFSLRIFSKSGKALIRLGEESGFMHRKEVRQTVEDFYEKAGLLLRVTLRRIFPQLEGF